MSIGISIKLPDYLFLMKYIITEQQYRKLNKSSELISNAIVKYINKYISNGKRKITPKSRNYGNLREDWCINGKEVISVIYYFENKKFDTGSLLVSKNLVNILSESLSIRKTYVLNTIAEWYEETMIPKLEQLVGESGLSIDDVDITSYDTDCVPEPEKPKDITDDEMIDFIVDNTLYNRKEVIDRIDLGLDTLEDFYLQILDKVNSERIRSH